MRMPIWLGLRIGHLQGQLFFFFFFLPTEHTGHSKHPLPTTWEKTLYMNSTRCHQMVNNKIRLIILFAAKVGEALYSQQKQDWELTVAQIMNSLFPNSDLNWRKWQKCTRQFRCDLNQIPYNYTVEVTNRFKGLDLIEWVPEELWVEVDDIV